MPSCSTSDQGGAAAGPAAAATIAAVHPDIIQAHILARLDGPTLASASCASSNLNKLCSEEKLWKDFCNSSWPSTTDPLLQNAISTFPSGHRSFFSDSFSAVHSYHAQLHQYENISRLISAVDIHFEGKLICSRVIVTNTSTSWFQSSPFRIDLLEPKEMVLTPVKFAGDETTCMESIQHHMKLSWIMIDLSTKRALNVSSMMPVAVRRHWLTGEIKAGFSTVMTTTNGVFVQNAVLVTCQGTETGELHVRGVSMQVEDMEGKVLKGEDSLVNLQAAMQGHRRMKKEGEDKERYDLFLELKRELREGSQRRERGIDLMCVASGIIIFLGFWAFIFFK